MTRFNTPPHVAEVLKRAEAKGRALKAHAAARLSCMFHRASELPLALAMEVQTQTRALAAHIGVALDETADATVTDDASLWQRLYELYDALEPSHGEDEQAMRMLGAIQSAVGEHHHERGYNDIDAGGDW